MPDVTQILTAVERGDQHAADDLLPLVYDELKKLASARLANERPDQTLQATALVHEAYLRLIGPMGESSTWNSRGHFFAAAAEAMRRIIIDLARKKRSQRRGGEFHRVALTAIEPAVVSRNVDILVLDEAIDHLAERDPRAAELVKLRFFSGLTVAEAAQALGVSVATAENDWAYAKACLKMQLADDQRQL